MSVTKSLIEKLKEMLHFKKSRAFYADKLGITLEEVDELFIKLRETPEAQTVIKFDEEVKRVNKEEGTLESIMICSYAPKNDKELAELHKVDLGKYKISSYWTKQRGDKFTSSLLCTLIKGASPEKFQEDFREFLTGFKPSKVIIKDEYVATKPKIALVLPKQDAHYNKWDTGGDNCIKDRFTKDQKSVLNMLLKAKATNSIEEVVYIVGSDQFNSEWTGMTTKFTPQTNILTYQEAFQEICNHEVEIVTTLLHYSQKVKVVFVPGNHDEFVGWHLISWLESYFRENKDISFDSSIENTKYFKYGNSAIMLNHGDDIKPKELAYKFPVGFKEKWSDCNHFYIFTGDKHAEMSLDIHGIKFYQVPQLSNAKSRWDDKKGYIDGKGEMTSFVISENSGMSDIYKQIL